MRLLWCLIGLLPVIVPTQAVAQDPAILSKVIFPRGPGFGAGEFKVLICEKEKDCVVQVDVAPDPFDPKNNCLLKVPAVVIASKKTKKIFWEITSLSGGPYRFNTDPAKAIDIANNFDRSGQQAFKDHTNVSSDKHRKEVNTGEAGAFTYTIRADTKASGQFQPCTPLDPVIVSRD